MIYPCRTALHLAARSGALSVLHVLLEDLEPGERTEYVNEADRNGITPVFLAKQRGEAQPAVAGPGRQAAWWERCPGSARALLGRLAGLASSIGAGGM